MKAMKQNNISVKNISCILFLVASLIIPVSCKKPQDPGPNEVFMENKNFVPNQINITAGTTITWNNQEAVYHTVTSDNNLFDSGKLDKDKTFKYTFSTAGVYYYHSNTDANMTGAVVVQ